MNGSPLAGIGLKDAYMPSLLQRSDGVRAIGFVEVHAENLMAAGGPRLAQTDKVRQLMPLSVHGVGLSIGSMDPPCERHLQRLERVLRRYEPRWFSEHLAWSSHRGAWFNDLLPLPYDEATLKRVCRHVDQVQHRLGRTMLLENPSTYVQYAASTMDEAAFLAEVVARTGCGLLLDVNNAYVSAVNRGGDARTYLDQLLDLVPPGSVGEIHLAGHATDADAVGAPLLIDSHGAPVSEPVWALYQHVIGRIGPVATLIERDQDLPPFPELAAEAARASDLMADVEALST